MRTVVVTIEGEQVRTVSPEGLSASMPLTEVLGQLAPPSVDTCGLVLPDGVKAALPGSKGVVVVHQTPPRVYGFRWIAGDSPERFGEGTVYRDDVRISLPYLVVLALFGRGPDGRLLLSNSSECFFLNHPLKSLSDELRFPALLNCSRFEPPRGKPLSWICTQHLDRKALAREPDESRRLTRSLHALLAHLLESGFNYSSEHHESGSWYTATTKAEVDHRVQTVEAWEEATRSDPLFVLEVPWLRTGRSVFEVARRMLEINQGRATPVASAEDIARILFNNRGRKRRKSDG